MLQSLRVHLVSLVNRRPALFVRWMMTRCAYVSFIFNADLPLFQVYLDHPVPSPKVRKMSPREVPEVYSAISTEVKLAFVVLYYTLLFRKLSL